MPALSLLAARNLALSAQGLLQPPTHPAGKADVLAAIRQIGALQIDTINVVARSPYLALWSRLGDYDPAWLNQLLAEGAVFEYWSHAASFLPIEDYPYYRRFILDGKHWHHYKDWYPAHKDEVDAILAHIQQNGAARSADFERKDGKKGGTWWDWKIEKDALEHWFTMGELMIARRDKFQRVYDLRERVLPDWDDGRAPTTEDTNRVLTLKAIECLGIARPGWVADYFRLPKEVVKTALKDLQSRDLIRPVEVEGWEEPALVSSGNGGLVQAAFDGTLQATYTTLLPPFDSLIWDRNRTRQLFNFDYALECYLPAPKRVYGYYLLTILHRGELVGRLDAKANRQLGRFEVKALYLEPGVQIDVELIGALVDLLCRCAAWHKTPQVAIQKTVPENLLAALEQALQARPSQG
jgi:uncharacterized protein YcaQ